MTEQPVRITSRRGLLVWVTRQQLGIQIAAFAWSLIRMGAVAALPVSTGFAVQEVMNGSPRGLALTGMLVLALGLVVAIGETALHRATILSWIAAARALQRVVARQICVLGAELDTRVAVGEVVSVSTIDIGKIGSLVDSVARCVAAVFVSVVLCGYMVVDEPQLGLPVVLGSCLVALTGLPFLGIAARRANGERSASGQVTALASDTVAGLRVLRGIGGESLFLSRYRQASQSLMKASVHSARATAGIETLRVATSGLLLVAVTWYGARLAVTGRINPGQLVAAYGVVAYLLVLLRTIQDGALRLAMTLPALERVTGLLAQERTFAGTFAGEAPELPSAADLIDPLTGLVAPSGLLTAVVCTDFDGAEKLAERLGGHPVNQPGEPSALLGSVALGEAPLQAVRAAVVLQDKNPFLFSGPLRDLLRVPGSGHVTPEAALDAAMCRDVLSVLAEHDDPMLTEITSQGRSLSGGQRQRLALARSLVADPDVLVLDEPTSAVDSYTEEQIARGVTALRRGRTTVVFTSSPAFLNQADLVVFIHGGRVVASGVHKELLQSVPEYQDVVGRS